MPEQVAPGFVPPVLHWPVAVSQVARDYTAQDIALFSTVGAFDSTDDTFSDLS